MNYFDLTENISTIDRVLRISAGTALLLSTLTDAIPGVHPSIFPMIAAYLILTAIIKWDPAGYVIEVALRILGQADAVTAPPAAKPLLTCTHVKNH
jgi:hypothetical protein